MNDIANGAFNDEAFRNETNNRGADRNARVFSEHVACKFGCRGPQILDPDMRYRLFVQPPPIRPTPSFDERESNSATALVEKCTP